MIFKLLGHDYKYAVEQILFTLFPGEPFSYEQEPSQGGNYAEISLTHGKVYSTAVTKLQYQGKLYRGVARGKTPVEDSLEYPRQMQKLLKLSFYRGGILAVKEHPPWGALTGIRPGKMATKLLLEGKTPGEIVKKFTKLYHVSDQRASLSMDTAKASIQLKNKLAPQDIFLYVGIPFCPSRCTYCSFVSNSVEKSAHLIEPFLDCLEAEMVHTGNLVRQFNLRVKGVYIGGGTPTSLTSPQLAKLMEQLAVNFDFSHVDEYTVEAGRPDTLDMEKLRIIRHLGANRISINPQSMQEQVLKAIGRKHSAKETAEALALARKVGFPVINMDFIAGLPADTVEGFAKSLSWGIETGVENITVHTLARKKGTKITEKEILAPDGKQMAQMLDFSLESLIKAEYKPYYLYRHKFTAGGFENIGWSKTGTAGAYNIAIMEEYATIMALGGGASTKLFKPETGKLHRIFNPKYPLEYIGAIHRILEKKSKEIEGFYSPAE